MTFMALTIYCLTQKASVLFYKTSVPEPCFLFAAVHHTSVSAPVPLRLFNFHPPIVPLIQLKCSDCSISQVAQSDADLFFSLTFNPPGVQRV